MPSEVAASSAPADWIVNVLGHHDHDRSRYRGPEHRKCNRATTKAPLYSRRW